ncbi:DUF805 domain-containing protein [Pelagerythrobacter sp.]|uniref:DUF805 domain-containing protein n=1 Tax=Pelagerythrobacter sp. TaxID=2800702 RepID=UPI0035AEC380
MHWMILPLKRYAEFSGRSRRMEYWMFALLNVIVMAVVFLLMGVTGSLGDVGTVDPANPLAIYGTLFTGVGLLLAVWFLAILIPGIAVGVRRLHDRNMSGWWYLGFIVVSFIPFIGLIASIAFLVVMLLPGTPGPNRFGEDPKGRGASEVFE